MNNDISEVNKFLKPANNRRMLNHAECSAVNPSSETVEDKQVQNMENSLNYLGSMGCAQVKMNNPMAGRVRESVDSFLDDPEYTQAHTELCDELVEKGYPLESAIDVTDRFFGTLKEEDTYR